VTDNLEKLHICGVCEFCIPQDDRPHCEKEDKPVAAVVNTVETCPEGKW
jgi:hypothetical protein